MYNNGGEGYWQKCLIDETEVTQTGIIQQEETKRIRVTYQISENGKTWSQNFTNIQEAENTKYLKVKVEYQAIQGNKYGDTSTSKIKVILNDGSWKITFLEEDGTTLFIKRVYFAKPNKQGTITIPNYKNAIGEKEFMCWKENQTQHMPNSEYTVTQDTTLTAYYIKPTLTINAKEITKEQIKLEITTNYTPNMVQQYIYHIKGTNKDQKYETNEQTKLITELTPNTTYKIYAEAKSTTGKTIKSNEIDITTQENTPPQQATIVFDKEKADINQTIKATVTQNDLESGIDIEKCKYIINQTIDKIGENSESWKTAQNLDQNPKTINITKATNGTYYLHVLSVDKVGNKLETVSSGVIFKQGEIVYLYMESRK